MRDVSGVRAVRDRIELRGVQAYGYHGALAQERADGQQFLVDLVLDLDLSCAARSDRLADTVSYAEVAELAVRIVQGEPADLIETVAERIASAVLAYSAVEAVEVALHKPHAPIPVPFADVAVRLRREREAPVVIALGGNVGEVARNFEEAVAQLRSTDGVRVEKVAPPLASDPVGGPDQPAYLNTVLLARTRLAPRVLLDRLHEIEAAHGRVRASRWAPRTLDLDLIQYGDPQSEVVCGRSGEPADDPPDGQGPVRAASADGVPQPAVEGQDGLMLPHPRAHQRAFVLQPWLDLDPNARLHVHGRVRAVSELLAGLDRSGLRPAHERAVPC